MDRKAVLKEMTQAGMDLVRLNFSHGKHADHTALFNGVRDISKEFDNQLSIICDIQGPKIRTGIMREPFLVAPGHKIDVTNLDVTGTPECIQISYENIVRDLDKGDTIFVNDGIIKLVVEGKDQTALHCVVEAGGMISDHKGCNIPKGNLSVDIVTPKDRKDLQLIAQLNPEYLAASFVEKAEHISLIRGILKEFGNETIKIIAKIERPIALENIDAIIEATDGIMVARGDLGVEIDTWLVPMKQKEICKKCNAAGKPVIVATQMLESMTSSPRPTRAEASDVFNAVLDGADAVMLSGETSVGQYPVQAVLVMDSIVNAAEKQFVARDPSLYISKHLGMTETNASEFPLDLPFLGAMVMSTMMSDLMHWNPKIIVLTGPPSGYVARMVSKFRPNFTIIAFSEDMRTARELNLVWGVRSVFNDKLEKLKTLEERSYEMGLVSLSDHVIVVSRSLIGKHVGEGGEGGEGGERGEVALTFFQAVKTSVEMGLVSLSDHVIVVSRSLIGKHVGTASCVYYVKEVLEKSAEPFKNHF